MLQIFEQLNLGKGSKSHNNVATQIDQELFREP